MNNLNFGTIYDEKSYEGTDFVSKLVPAISAQALVINEVETKQWDDGESISMTLVTKDPVPGLENPDYGDRQFMYQNFKLTEKSLQSGVSILKFCEDLATVSGLSGEWNTVMSAYTKGRESTAANLKEDIDKFLKGKPFAMFVKEKYNKTTYKAKEKGGGYWRSTLAELALFHDVHPISDLLSMKERIKTDTDLVSKLKDPNDPGEPETIVNNGEQSTVGFKL